MNKQSNDTRTPLPLHAARLVFPPLAALVVLVLTEWIARSARKIRFSFSVRMSY